MFALCALLLAPVRIAHCGNVVFEEAFSGQGPYESVDGAFTGLDNPDWLITHTGQVDTTSDGLWFMNSGISDGIGETLRIQREVASDDIRSFVNRIEVNGFQMGVIDRVITGHS